MILSQEFIPTKHNLCSNSSCSLNRNYNVSKNNCSARTSRYEPEANADNNRNENNRKVLA